MRNISVYRVFIFQSSKVKSITVSNQRGALLEVHRMYVIIFFISLCYHRDIILCYENMSVKTYFPETEMIPTQIRISKCQ